jgi:hypothetical protein
MSSINKPGLERSEPGRNNFEFSVTVDRTS